MHLDEYLDEVIQCVKEVNPHFHSSVSGIVREGFVKLTPNGHRLFPQVKRIVKLVGFVNCVDGFSQQPMVVNGASDFFVQVFGDKGVHARSAVGTNALPLNIPVEIEAVVEVED